MSAGYSFVLARLCGVAFVLASVFGAALPSSSVQAAERAEVLLFVLDQVDIGGVVLPMIVPQANKALADAGPSSRPTKAFDALRARSPKAYGATSLRIDSATRATLVLDKMADADQVLAEVYWSLSAQGFTEILAPPFIKTSVTIEDLSYAAHVPIVYMWDLLRFYEQINLVASTFVIESGKPVLAMDAIKKLQKGDPGLKKQLTDALAGNSMRAKIAYLEAIADGSMRQAFKFKADDALPGLKDPSVAVRGVALDAVIASGFKSPGPVDTALEDLVENDGDAELKLRAVKALSKSGNKKYEIILESEKLRTGTAKEALEAVEKLAKSAQVKIAAPALVGALSHSDANVREAAFKGLVALKQYDLLQTAMEGDQLSAQMREQIAMVLVENGSAAAQDQSLQYLITKGKAPGAIFACQTYGKRGAKTASPALIDALKHESAEVRAAAAEALALLKDERAIVPLADAADAKARDKEVMMKAAVEILASLRLEQVKSLVSSKNIAVRQMAIRALADFAKGSRPRPDVVAILQEAKKDPDINIKRSAVYALARLQDDGIARDLAEMKKDSDAEVRQQVALSQGSASSKYAEADDILVEMVADPDKRVRIEAINGLAKRKAPAGVEKISKLVTNPDAEVKRAAHAALLALRDPSNAEKLRPIFRRGMDFNDSAVRLTCVQALSDKVTAEDIEALRKAAFDNSKEVKVQAIAALGSSKLAESMDALANFLSDTDMEVREKALDALCSIPAGESSKAKMQYLKDAIDAADMPDGLKKKAEACRKKP